MFWLFCLSFNYMGLLGAFGSCDHFVSLQLDSKNTTLCQHETHYFAIIVNLTKSASLVGFKKKTMIFSALNTMCWNFSTFPTHVISHKQMDDKHLCMTNQLGQNRDWVSHPSFHIPSSCTYVDSLIVQIKLMLRSLFELILSLMASFHSISLQRGIHDK